MDALAHYTIPVSGLQNGFHEYDFEVNEEFFRHFPESLVKDGQVNVHFTFDKRPDLYVMEFDLNGTVKTICDRCLEEFDLPVEDTQTLLVKFDEKAWEDADVIYILKGTQQMNVAKYIYEFINLAVPMTKTHDNAGESCNPDMLKLLQKEDPESFSGWEPLKNFSLDN